MSLVIASKYYWSIRHASAFIFRSILNVAVFLLMEPLILVRYWMDNIVPLSTYLSFEMLTQIRRCQPLRIVTLCALCEASGIQLRSSLLLFTHCYVPLVRLKESAHNVGIPGRDGTLEVHENLIHDVGFLLQQRPSCFEKSEIYKGSIVCWPSFGMLFTRERSGALSHGMLEYSQIAGSDNDGRPSDDSDDMAFVKRMLVCCYVK